MLRWALLLVAGAAALVSTAGVLLGRHELWPVAAWSAALTAAVLAERWRYRHRSSARDDGWETTGERFTDPSTGQALQVLYHPATGERRYEPLNRRDDGA